MSFEGKVRKVLFNNFYRRNVFNKQLIFFISFISFFGLIVFFTTSPSHYLPNKSMKNYKAMTFTKFPGGKIVKSKNSMQTKLIWLVVDGLSYRFVKETVN